MFHLEIIIKLFALKIFYFKGFWNKFDMFLLISTDILIMFYYNLNTFKYYTIPIIVRGLRLIKLNNDVIGMYLMCLVQVAEVDKGAAARDPAGVPDADKFGGFDFPDDLHLRADRGADILVVPDWE